MVDAPKLVNFSKSDLEIHSNARRFISITPYRYSKNMCIITVFSISRLTFQGNGLTL